MPMVTPCPSAEQLQRFLLATLPGLEAQALEQHLLECPHCLPALRATRAEDALVEAVRAQATLPGRAPGNEVVRLIERFKTLPAPAAAVPTSAPATVGAEEGGTAMPALAEAPGPCACSSSPSFDFLAPPRNPGELGWLGPYRVLRVLGSGGMGVVFEAKDPQLQRLVALKTILPHRAESLSGRQRFLREARAAAAIKHDNIVTIHQVGEDGGVPFLAMEFLEGESLESRLKSDEKLLLAEALRVGREMAEGLAAAHERGLIHRDIKPANVWLEGKRARVKILDFGLARAADDPAHLTHTGDILGTPAYMAPEQAHGEAVDHRCDLFSLGCVLYRLSTGQSPFKGRDKISTLMAVASEQPPAPHQDNPGVPPALSELIVRLLEKDPGRRPASAREVIEALTAIEREPAPAVLSTIEARPVAHPGSVTPARRRRRWLLAAAALLVGLGVMAGVVLRIRGPDGKETQITVPEGSQTKVDDKGQVTVTLPQEPKATKPPRVMIEPEPWDLPRGKPLSPMTFVSRPSEIKGVRSWTLESRFHRSAASSMAYRPDGSLLATGGWDGTIRLWDGPTGRLMRVLMGHTMRVNSVAWSPAGDALVSGSEDKTVRLWDVEAGRLLRTLREHLAPVREVAWSPDGKTIASAGGGVRLWDIASDKHHEILDAGGGWIETVAWSPDGRMLATGGGDKLVRLWDATSERLLRTLEGHTDLIKSGHWRKMDSDWSILLFRIFDKCAA